MEAHACYTSFPEADAEGLLKFEANLVYNGKVSPQTQVETKT